MAIACWWRNAADPKDTWHGWPEEPCGEYSDPQHTAEDVEEMRRWTRKFLWIMTPIVIAFGVAIFLTIKQIWGF